MNLGQICIKTAGREAGKIAVIVDVIDDNFVMIDGNVRRKKCNIRHLEPTEKIAKIGKNASTQDVMAALKSLGLKTRPGRKFSKKAKQQVKEVSKKEEKPAKKAKKK